MGSVSEALQNVASDALWIFFLCWISVLIFLVFSSLFSKPRAPPTSFFPFSDCTDLQRQLTSLFLAVMKDMQTLRDAPSLDPNLHLCQNSFFQVELNVERYILTFEHEPFFRSWLICLYCKIIYIKKHTVVLYLWIVECFVLPGSSWWTQISVLSGAENSTKTELHIFYFYVTYLTSLQS